MIEFVEYDDMPDDNEDIAKFNIAFPLLDEIQTKRYREFVEPLIDYLHDEEETIESDDLNFIKAVQVKDRKYWIWEFRDQDDDLCYVVASEDSYGTLRLCYDQNWYNLSPDQFIIGDYHNVF
jgi:hypothetical protein